MRLRRIAAVGAVAAMAVAVAGTAYGDDTDVDPDQSKGDFSTVCPDGGNMQVDPIGQYGVAPSMHMHSFVGQSMVPFFEQAFDPTHAPQDLKPIWLTDDGDTSSCLDITPDGTDDTDDTFYDKSEYWTPALLSTLPHPAQYFQPSKTLIYYRDAGVDPDTIQPFPDGLSMIGGHQDGTNQPWEVEWSCVAGKDDDGTHHEVEFGETIPQVCPQTSDGSAAYTGPDATKNYSLRLVVYFPDCIDPDNGSSPPGAGQWDPVGAEYAQYPSDPHVWGTRTCAPYGDTYEAIPQVQVGFRWALADLDLPATTTSPGNQPAWDLSSLNIASDAMNGLSKGASAHADFMSGWTREQIRQLLVDCYWSGNSPDPNHPNPRNCGHINNP